jgi:uncharacterized membrane protein
MLLVIAGGNAMRTTRIICVCVLLGVMLLLPLAAALAQDEQIELRTNHQKLEATWPGAAYEFEVDCIYTGTEGRYFDLKATAPTGWEVSITPQYGTQEIGDIRLEPDGTSTIKVTATPQSLNEPGEYVITLEASSGGLKTSVNLTAVIKDTYSLAMGPADNYNLNMSATAGKENYYSIKIQNTGSGTQEDIKLSSSKPSGWQVEFTPVTVGELSSGDQYTADVTIIPDHEAIAGDYEITLKATSEQSSSSVKVRVTVETPTVWGWVGIFIILAVVAGVIFIFMRFSRR